MPGTLIITLTKSLMAIVPGTMPPSITGTGDGPNYTLTSDGATAVYTSDSFSDITNSRLKDAFSNAGFGTDTTSLQGITLISGTGNFAMSGQYYFSAAGGVNNLTTLDFSTVTMSELPHGMFWDGCKGLTTVYWPIGLTTINQQCFNQCDSFLNIVIPDTVTSILGDAGDSPFFTTAAARSNIVTYTINSNVTTITGTTGINSDINNYTPPSNVTLITDSLTSPAAIYFTANYSGANITVNEPIICFKEGSQILTDKGYVAVEDLRNGDLVKTISSGFKKIEHIGHSKMYNNANDIRTTDKLYKCCKSEYPELTKDLVITGGHSILVSNFKDHEQTEKTQEVLGKIYVTDGHYRLPACVDDRTKIFEEVGVHTIWHFSLEHSNYYMNYGVYANGLLVETASNRMMVELSGMTLL
jgi:hypothetical protein